MLLLALLLLVCVSLLRLHLFATHFGGLSSDQPPLLPHPVERMAFRKRADSSQGSVHALKNLHFELCLVTALCNQRTEKNNT